ncbi:MAG TPA: serine/threonine-protein kinase [Holophagaceae bacterium]|nr:serine/threonine-protein kinase [Holophagaceae bacterium]
MDTLGRFQLLRPLGRGAMGEVYLAKDPALGREVALKTIRPELVGVSMGGDVVARFEREAQAAARLKHPGVVTVYEFGKEGDLLYLVQEFVEGESLSDLLSHRALSRADLVEVVAQVCEGLHHAHKQGIIHRDIKPANIMVSRDEGRPVAKILDFGVAKISGAEFTQTGQVVGTLAYMAPEYLRTAHATAASDQFSVGVLLFEGLSGERPFQGETTGAVVYNIIHDAPKTLDSEHLEGLSPALRGILARALAKDPLARFPSLLDLARSLRSALDPRWAPSEDATTALQRADSHATTAPRMATEPTLALPSGPKASRQGLWIGAALLVVALGGAGLWLSQGGRLPGLKAAKAPRSYDNLLREAERSLDSRPREAIHILETVLEASPKDATDPDILALLLVAHYKDNDLVRFGEVLGEAGDRGITPMKLLGNDTYTAMLESDQRRKRLPQPLRERLLKGLEK